VITFLYGTVEDSGRYQVYRSYSILVWCIIMLVDLGAEIIRIKPPWSSLDRVANAFIVGGFNYKFYMLNLNN